MKYLILLLLMIFAVGCNPDVKTFNGYVEGEYVYIATTTSGLLQTLSVSRGQPVKRGDDLFALDQTNLQAVLASAESGVTEAKATLSNASLEYDRARLLVTAQAVSQSEYEAKKAAFDSSRAALQGAIQKVVQAKKQLVESAPKAPNDGRIEDTYYRAGEYIAAGAPVVSLLPPENVRVRFFVPQALLPSFPLEGAVTIHCDGCDKPVKAKINFIASQGEYTPPVIYSVGSRDKLVFRVEAIPETFTPALRPGLPVDIERSAL